MVPYVVFINFLSQPTYNVRDELSCSAFVYLLSF